MKNIHLKLFSFIFGIALFTLIAIPSVYAASPGLALTPETITAGNSCVSEEQVEIDTGSIPTNAADIVITYDPSKITIIDADPTQLGTQVKTGNAFTLYLGNNVDATSGRITLTGLSTPRTGKATVAIIQFTPKQSSGSTALNFSFFGANTLNTKDSNIANATTSEDMLASVSNATINFTAANCSADTIAPLITFIAPQNSDTSVIYTNPITFDVSDSNAGVDLSSVTATINGNVYTSSSSGVTVTGNPNKYSFTINYPEEFPKNSASILSITAKDLKSNFAHNSIIFNQPKGKDTGVLPTQLTCPNASSKDIGRCVTNIINAVFNPAQESSVFQTILTLISLSILGIPPLLFIGIPALQKIKRLFNFLRYAYFLKNPTTLYTINSNNAPLKGIKVSMVNQEGKILFKTYTNKHGQVLYNKQIDASPVIDSAGFVIKSNTNSTLEIGNLKTARTKLHSAKILTAIIAGSVGITIIGTIFWIGTQVPIVGIATASTFLIGLASAYRFIIQHI